MENNNKVVNVMTGSATKSVSGSTMRNVNHEKNTKAFDPMDLRVAILESGKKRHYHFCSPTLTDFTDANVDLNYLGVGKIHSIKGEKYNGSDKNEEMHFWRLASYQFNQFD